MYNICKCSSNLHQHIKIRIKNVPGDWDKTIVPGGPGPCPWRAVTRARGTAERSEHRAVGMGLKLARIMVLWCQIHHSGHTLPCNQGLPHLCDFPDEQT